MTTNIFPAHFLEEQMSTKLLGELYARPQWNLQANKINVLIHKLSIPDIMAVAEIECRDDLSEESSGLLWCETALLDEVVEQLPARHMLQHQVPGNKGDSEVLTTWAFTKMENLKEA